MSPWGWRPERTQGIWRHGPLWLRPLALVSPWAAAALCFMLMYVVGDSLTAAQGIAFELPGAVAGERADSSLVALMLPLKNESAVFFDDVRYSIGDGTSAAMLRENLGERLGKVPQKTLLVLADKRIPCGDIERFAAIARASGAEKVLFANKRTEARDE